MSERLKKYIEFERYRLLLSDSVIQPGEDTLALVDQLRAGVETPEVAVVVGCGTGLLALVCAERAKFVIANDLSQSALALSQQNLTLNHARAPWVCVRGDMLSFVGDQTVDLVVMNAPQLPSLREENSDHWVVLSHEGGISGREVLDRFVQEAPRVLKRPRGRMIFIQFGLYSVDRTAEILGNNGMEIRIRTSYYREMGVTSYPRRYLWNGVNDETIAVYVLEARFAPVR